MHRMYIDEVGNPDLKASQEPNHRYLSLTGIILDCDYVQDVLSPRIEELKRIFFKSHCDEPLILHRKELVNKNHPFHALRDPVVEAAFNSELLALIQGLDFVVMTATIDKLEHVSRYSSWQHHPYHYCQEVLLERYVRWLNRRGLRGDVFGESRGKKEDGALKAAFREIRQRGSAFVRPQEFHCLCALELKLKRKQDNVAGLQLADLVAHPSFKAMLARRHRQSLPENFGGRIATILEEWKYDRSPNGRIEGWGRKWLP
jgi:hypothetical protein